MTLLYFILDNFYAIRLCNNPPLCQDLGNMGGGDVNTVLNRITFKELDEWVNEPLADDVFCLDIEGSSRRRPSDDQIWLKIKDKTGVTNSTSFQQLDDNKREKIFLELKDCGASLRQLERLTGIGKGVIHRIWCAGH